MNAVYLYLYFYNNAIYKNSNFCKKLKWKKNKNLLLYLHLYPNFFWKIRKSQNTPHTHYKALSKTKLKRQLNI